MTAQIINGKEIAKGIREELAKKVTALREKRLRVPGLAVILVGENPASQVYVNSKRKACQEIGFISKAYDLPDDTTEAYLLKLIDGLNNDPTVDGILVQLPLPKHIDSTGSPGIRIWPRTPSAKACCPSSKKLICFARWNVTNCGLILSLQ